MSKNVTVSLDVTVPWTHHPSTLRALQLGPYDPTVRVGHSECIVVRRHGVLHLNWKTDSGSTTYRAHFTGDVEHPEHTLTKLIGDHELCPETADDHTAVRRSTSRHRNLRIAGSGLVFVESVKAVLGQRITGRDAGLQWARLVRATSEPLDSQGFGLLHLPTPEAIMQLSSAAFHSLGIEERRARTIRQLADVARRGHLDTVDTRAALAEKVSGLTGFGPWSIAVASAQAFGDTDALPVGDFHHKNTVTYALTGRARGTDDEMIRLLLPYAGWRWWVTRCLSLDYRAPRFDHRRRNLDIRTM